MNFPLYLSYRYFKSKKSMNVVNIIVIFSIVALTFSSAAMIILLSGFSGLQSMNIRFISDVNPELKISAVKGKYIQDVAGLKNKLKSYDEIQDFSEEIDEKIYLTYRERSEVAEMKAVDSEFNKIFPLDTAVIAGQYFSNVYTNELILSNQLAFRLNIPISDNEFAQVYVPKPGEGRINNIEDNFTIKPANLIGVFYINENYEKTVFTTIEFARSLLGLSKNQASALDLKLRQPEIREDLKIILQNELGPDFLVQTREDQDAAYLRMMNIEKLWIYLLMTLVIIISTFTLAGAVVVIILDKKKQTQTLMSLGMTKKNLRKSYFYTGMYITISSLILGLLIGSILIYLQDKYHLVKVNQFFAFPVEYNVTNYIIVIVTVMLFGGLVSYLTSRKLYY